MFAHQKLRLTLKKSDIAELGWKEKFASVCIEVCIRADSQALHLSSFYSLKLMSHCHLNWQQYLTTLKSIIDFTLVLSENVPKKLQLFDWKEAKKASVLYSISP